VDIPIPDGAEKVEAVGKCGTWKLIFTMPSGAVVEITIGDMMRACKLANRLGKQIQRQRAR